MALPKELEAHLASGTTQVCRCWSVRRRDGAQLGFTDHDRDLEFEGTVFRANSGMTARALQQTTGLSVDNTEALGALSDVSVTEADIQAGRFDGAEVRSWLVHWADVALRTLQFRGTFGELQRAGGAFQVELRGLTEALNRPRGDVFQAPCPAILGDWRCRFALTTPGYFSERAVEQVDEGRVFTFADGSGFEDRWFECGRFEVLTGAATGLTGVVKNDRVTSPGRRIDLWQAVRAPIVAGDMVRLTAGCDKRAETCQLKFENFLNFRGFPDIPGEDWLMSYPAQSGVNDGGSLTR